MKTKKIQGIPLLPSYEDMEKAVIEKVVMRLHRFRNLQNPVEECELWYEGIHIQDKGWRRPEKPARLGQALEALLEELLQWHIVTGLCKITFSISFMDGGKDSPKRFLKLRFLEDVLPCILSKRSDGK